MNIIIHMFFIVYLYDIKFFFFFFTQQNLQLDYEPASQRKAINFNQSSRKDAKEFIHSSSKKLWISFNS